MRKKRRDERVWKERRGSKKKIGKKERKSIRRGGGTAGERKGIIQTRHIGRDEPSSQLG
jgi:hypothetical protein